MASPNAVPIRGLFPAADREWTRLGPPGRSALLRSAGDHAVSLLRDQLRRGLDRRGRRMAPRVRPVLADGARGPVLTPHGADSRARKWLRFSTNADGVTLHWSHGFAAVIGHQADAPKRRDVRGLSPANERRLRDRCRVAWLAHRANARAADRAGRRRPAADPVPTSTPRARLRPARPGDLRPLDLG